MQIFQMYLSFFDEADIHCGDQEVEDNEVNWRLKDEHMGLWDP